MNRRIPALLLLLLLLFTAPALAADLSEGENSEVKIVLSEVLIQTNDAVKQTGWTVNGADRVEKIFVTHGDEVTIVLNSIPRGMDFKVVILVDGEIKEENTTRTIVIRGFSADEPHHITVQMTLTGGDPSDTPQGTSTWLTETPAPTPTQTEPTPTQTPDTPSTSSWMDWLMSWLGWILHHLWLLLLILLGLFLIILFLLRVIYRLLKRYAKKYDYEVDRKQFKEIAHVIIEMLRSEDVYPDWRDDQLVEKRLKGDIIRTLDEMQYPPVPRDEISEEILKAGKGITTRWRL